MYKAVKYNPEIHHRRSIRLKGYNYSRPGMYFVTICVQNKDYLFGEIIEKMMILNEAGRMIERWYFELQNKFPDIKCHTMIVMPNHFHCIIENTGAVPDVNDVPVSGDIPVSDGMTVSNDVPVGADLRVCPYYNGEHEISDGQSNWGEHVGTDGQSNWGEHVGTDGQSNWGEYVGTDGQSNWGEHVGTDGQSNWGEHVGSPLHRVLQWFKTMTTNEYIRGVKHLGWPRFDGKLWQRNYYERIIRNDQSYWQIANYIKNNPARWNDDHFFPIS